MSSPEKTRINPHEFSKFGIDLGQALLDRSSLSEETMTQVGIRNIRRLLTEGGSVILNDHRTRTDMFCAGVQLINNSNVNRAVAPFGEYLDDNKIYRSIFNRIRKGFKGKIELFKVVRGEIREGERPNIKINLSEDEMKELNRRYKKRVLSIPNETGTILYAAAYGSTQTYRRKEKIRRVTIDVLRAGCPLVCTYAVKVPQQKRQRIGPYEIFISDKVLTFMPNATKGEVRDAIDAEYDYLERKAREKYPLEGTKLFIFDWSGTLSDDRLPVYEAIMRICDKNNIPRGSFEEWLSNIQGDAASELILRGLSGDLDYLFNLYEQSYGEVISTGLNPQVYDEAKKTLKFLSKKKLPIIVLSLHPEKNLINEAKKYGLSKFIDHIIGSIKDKKEAILEVCQAYGLDPKNVVYIGDTTFDMASARESGVRSVAVSKGYHSREKLEAENPTLVLSSLTELIKYIH